MGRRWNMVHETLETIVGFIIKLVILAVIVLVVYFVWVNFIKKAQTEIDKGSDNIRQTTENRLMGKK